MKNRAGRAGTHLKQRSHRAWFSSRAGWRIALCSPAPFCTPADRQETFPLHTFTARRHHPPAAPDRLLSTPCAGKASSNMWGKMHLPGQRCPLGMCSENDLLHLVMSLGCLAASQEQKTFLQVFGCTSAPRGTSSSEGNAAKPAPKPQAPSWAMKQHKAVEMGDKSKEKASPSSQSSEQLGRANKPSGFLRHSGGRTPLALAGP